MESVLNPTHFIRNALTIIAVSVDTKSCVKKNCESQCNYKSSPVHLVTIEYLFDDCVAALFDASIVR